ncbi:gamma-glutamylputrescine oxidase [Paucibacter oligotrophus]|uniref:Gamma-glutamylputrescine oxidase n=1 Tax=Roseateles oligotrophus TaxID=1769250 RepID=A0A840L9L9_9BURK|nr:FAD-binding oxidoreductase [Roseateles oligotrophus]MBB4844870.1 gamma-glutamylputrescine oxidase [Roseateles oligotrophus]
MSLLSIDRELSRDSYYVATAPRQEAYAPLQENWVADVAIVGAGLAGLSAAIELAEKGRKVVLLEAGQVGGGASGRNGGQAIHGLACEQGEIERQLGLADARRVWAMSLEALDILQQRMHEHRIAADWQAGFMSLATNEKKAAELRQWQQRMAEVYDYPMQWIAPQEIGGWIASPRFKAGVHDPRSGHLHPLKYCQGLAAAAQRLGVRICEHSAVTKLDEGQVLTLHTAGGQVRAAQALLAGNIYLPEIAPQLAPRLASRIMPVGTYIVCSEAMDAARCQALIPSRSAVCDTNFILDYFRPTADQRLLYGGRVSYSTRSPRSVKASMHAKLLRSFPQLLDVGMQFAWGGFVDISMNRAPDFGRIGAARNIYYLQGFSGHGLALTGLAGRVTAEAMQGDSERFDVFAKLRHQPFPGGKLFRTPALVLGMLYYRLKDLL